ncbi:hypothetical protein FAVG1_04191 [Fusarium avenaceum]|nr:hypothetical protein FAVG1_04191 [Fusarium avenaceum]
MTQPILPSAFQALPSELIAAICNLLSNRDVKNLRLTYRYLRDKSPLRFDRVYISANPRNIEVLTAIANHEVFRHRVKEIIWDDATLKSIPDRDCDGPCGYSADERDPDDLAANEDKEWISRRFVQLCKESIFLTSSRLEKKYEQQGDNDNEQQRQLDKLMPSRDSIAYWNLLIKQQEEVLESGADETAFRYAVQRFPRLSKVTVTPATHGFLFMPFYQTPMIRASPSGFVYPIPRGWPSDERLGYDRPDGFPEGWGNDEERKQWRGFCIVTKVLAEYAETLQISELALDNHKLPTGIDCSFFENPNVEYDNLCKIFEQPGFKSFTLSLITAYVTDLDVEDWHFYRNGRISSLLARAPDLEIFVFQTDYWNGFGGGSKEDFVSLLDIFPIDKWSTGKLKHFGLFGMQVTQGDLISFLAKLPSTLESIELSFLSMVKGSNYAGLLTDIRDKLGWRHRPSGQRIRVGISVPPVNIDGFGRYICLDKEVHEYIYGDGPSPFHISGGIPASLIPSGTGIVQDEFDPSFRNSDGKR